jgi:hypothetical protein
VRSPLRTSGQPGDPPARPGSRARTGPSALAAAVAATPAAGAVTRTGAVIMDGWVRPPAAPGVVIGHDLDPDDDLRVA